MDRPQLRIKRSTGGWAGRKGFEVYSARKSLARVPFLPSLRRPYRFRSGTVALKETKAFEHIAPNFPMRIKKVKREPVYVPKKEQYSLLPRRNSSRLQTSKPEDQDKVEKESSSLEMDEKVKITLNNARKQSRKDIDKFNTLLVALLQDRSLSISPVSLASYLMDLADKKSLFYWENAEPFHLVKMLKGASAHLSGLKEAVSQTFGEKIALVDEAVIKQLAKFYVAALKDGVMEPVTAIWATKDAWSTSLGIFLGQVFQRMESVMNDITLSRFLLDSGIVDIIMTGYGFEMKLGSQLKQCGVRARSILNKVCREKLINMLAGILRDDNAAITEDQVLNSARKLNIDEPSFTAMVWEAIITNLQSCGLQCVKSFRAHAQVLSEKERIKVVVRNNSLAFLASIEFPSRMNRLKKSVSAFLEDCVNRGVVDGDAVSRWKNEHKWA